MKILEKEIDYKDFTFAEKDQFFTPLNIVEHCFKVFNSKVDSNGYVFIEPSAGDGSFLKVLPKNTIAMDIEPRGENITKQDYLTYIPDKGKYIVFGNPPFGKKGSMALRFMNHSSFADYICFILPPCFKSQGKGSARLRVNFNLIHSENIESTFYNPNGKKVKVHVVFQIWSKYIINPDYSLKPLTHPELKVYYINNVSNSKMMNKCDRYITSTAFRKEKMVGHKSFDKLQYKRGYGIVFNNPELLTLFDEIEWCNVASRATNSAYHLNLSMIYNEFV